MKTKNENLLPFKNIHEGKRIFLIGNGPSLKKTDLDLISGDYSMGMNRISLIYPYTEWRPSYYVYCSENVNNGIWGEAWTEDVRKSAFRPDITSFIWTKFKSRILGGFKTASGETNTQQNIKWFSSVTEHGPGNPNSFSADAFERLDKSGTTMNLAMQLAFYMGFETIILVGCDLNWKTTTGRTDDPNHFDTRYVAKIKDGNLTSRNLKNTHTVIYKNLSELGVQVYNATLDTVLDVYPLITYEAVAEDKTWMGNGGVDEDSYDTKKKRQDIERFWSLM